MRYVHTHKTKARLAALLSEAFTPRLVQDLQMLRGKKVTPPKIRVIFYSRELLMDGEVGKTLTSGNLSRKIIIY